MKAIGAWNWRDVMIEVKAHLMTTNERDRAMGQLETYASTWPGAIVLMICGEGRPIAMVVKARAADGAPQ